MIGKSFLLAGLLLAATGAHAQETAWFVVAERGTPEHDDSFLLPLRDADDIAAARALVAAGPQPSGGIVVARIGAGADGLNRDVRADGTPLWSWHVRAFEQFADHTIELCDGWPGFIQQDVAGYIANTDGRVCFWGYTVVAELATPPAFEINGALDGAWFNPLTPGQGMFLDVMPDAQALGLGWFTFAEANPAAAEVGAATQRWLTAQGNYDGNVATLRLYSASGGYFDDPRPVQNTDTGQLTLTFADCNHATAAFAITNGPTGTMNLVRAVPVQACQQ